MLAVIGNIENKQNKDKAIRLYEAYYGTMLGTAFNILKDMALAEDAVSEAFVKVIKNIHKIRENSCYETRGYLVLIVRNTAINMLNKSHNKHETPLADDMEFTDNATPVLDSLTTKEACRTIADCIKALPKTLSDVLYLAVFLEHTYDEIADILGISKDAAKMRLSRAKRAVRALLERNAE